MGKDRSVDLTAEPRRFGLTAKERWDSTVLLVVIGPELYPSPWLCPGCRTYPELEARHRRFELIAK